jgi:hypothetical protein
LETFLAEQQFIVSKRQFRLHLVADFSKGSESFGSRIDAQRKMDALGAHHGTVSDRSVRELDGEQLLFQQLVPKFRFLEPERQGIESVFGHGPLPFLDIAIKRSG